MGDNFWSYGKYKNSYFQQLSTKVVSGSGSVPVTSLVLTAGLIIKLIKLTQDQINGRKTSLICAHWRVMIRCSDHKTRLKEMIEPDALLYLLDKETINLSEIGRKKKGSAHYKGI